MNRRLWFLALGIESVFGAITFVVLATAKSLGALSILLLQWPGALLLAPLERGNALPGVIVCILIFAIQSCLIWLGLYGLRALFFKRSGWQTSGRTIVVHAPWNRR